jgi:hypothetical protein
VLHTLLQKDTPLTLFKPASGGVVWGILHSLIDIFIYVKPLIFIVAATVSSSAVVGSSCIHSFVIFGNFCWTCIFFCFCRSSGRNTGIYFSFLWHSCKEIMGTSIVEGSSRWKWLTEAVEMRQSMEVVNGSGRRKWSTEVVVGWIVVEGSGQGKG